MRQLWEILVPTIMNDKPIRTRFHKVWDNKVREVAGGMTVLQPAKGQWVEPVSGELFKERMIPVRIACSREEIEKIIEMTISYYDQKAVMAYKISNEVIIKERDND